MCNKRKIIRCAIKTLLMCNKNIIDVQKNNQMRNKKNKLDVH